MPGTRMTIPMVMTMEFPIPFRGGDRGVHALEIADVVRDRLAAEMGQQRQPLHFMS